jgi:hypothetical protein
MVSAAHHLLLSPDINAAFPKRAKSLILITWWLGRQDSNLGMPVPKTGALPLGDAPKLYKIIMKRARIINFLIILFSHDFIKKLILFSYHAPARGT